MTVFWQKSIVSSTPLITYVVATSSFRMLKGLSYRPAKKDVDHFLQNLFSGIPHMYDLMNRHIISLDMIGAVL